MTKSIKKLKVMTVVGTRPEIIRLSRIISLLNEQCNHVLVHTGQNYDYELNQVFFDDLSIRKPDYFLDSAKDSAAATIGEIIKNIEPILDKEIPDALLVLGDTNSCLSAITAKKKKIPIFHFEAGNRAFDQRVPEEVNRKIVDHVSDLNLTYSQISRQYLIAEGFPADRVIKVGSPMKEVLNHHMTDVEKSEILKKLNLEKNKYILVSCHREENVDNLSNLKLLFSCFNRISKLFNLPIIVSTHPRTRKRLDQLDFKKDKNVLLHKPFGFLDYINLQINSKVVLSDSGTISEESSILGFKALNIRESHERPEAMEESAVMMTGLDERNIINCLNLLFNKKNHQKNPLVQDYNVDNVSQKVVEIIHSYYNYINKRVWLK